MASNHFGNLFRITTWGESHGKAIGVVIDGCPSGLLLSDEDINIELERRRPGKTPYTSQRQESDQAEIYSGIFEGKTTGAPISILIFNHGDDSTKYEPIKEILRPGHANYTYLKKYKIFDYRGGGRASARETACRVAAGAVAKKILKYFGIEVAAFLSSVGEIKGKNFEHEEIDSLKEATLQSLIFCPDDEASHRIIEAIEKAKEEGESLGGVVELRAEGILPGLGDPVYEKLDANLGKAMLSIPACKGVEIGQGFASTQMLGSEHNDLFEKNIEGRIITRTNHAGGILGGISNGMPLIVKSAFKPSSSILKSQMTLDIHKQRKHFSLPEGSKHDPCVAIRAVAVVEAMGAIVIADHLLLNRNASFIHEKEEMQYETSSV